MIRLLTQVIGVCEPEAREKRGKPRPKKRISIALPCDESQDPFFCVPRLRPGSAFGPYFTYLIPFP